MLYLNLYPSNPPADLPGYLSILSDNLSQPGHMAAGRAMITTSKRASEERLDRVSASPLAL